MQTAYDYYRTTHPGWGTNSFHFRAPPQPAFQPAPTWSGWDYYRAQAMNPDQNLYYTVMNRTRDFGPGGGAGMREARHWQRRVYSGLVNLSQLLPADIGMAAAYEAYRMWKHHHGVLFDPLLTAAGPGAMEREREAMVGLAIGEATRLWQYTNRPMDTYGLRDCLESASMTAFRISYEALGESAAAQPYATGITVADPYADPYGSSRRHRRHSNATPMMMAQQAPPSPYAGSAMPMSIPGRAGSSGSSVMGGSPYIGGGSPYRGHSPLGSTPPYATAGLGSSPYGGGMVGGMPQAGIAASGGYGGGGYGAGLSSSYGGGVSPLGYAASGGGAPVQYTTSQPGGYGYSSGAYQQPYGAGYAGSSGMPYRGQGVTIQHNGQLIPAQAGSTIVIGSRPRHKHHHRSRSIEPLRY